MIYLLLFLLGIGVGSASGLLGIGGGVALVPALMLLFGYSQQEAQGTSLAVMVPPIGLFAAIVYYQHGFIRLPVVLWVALGFILGAYVGARLVPIVPLTVLKVAFGAVLLYVGFLFVLAPHQSRAAAALPAGLATIASTLAARLFRRRTGQLSGSRESTDSIDYHI